MDDTVDDHPVGGCETRTDHPESAPKITYFDLLLGHDIVLADDHHGMIRQSRRLRRGVGHVGSAGAGVDTASCTRPNAPGVSSASAFFRVARAWIVPLPRSRALSTKSSVPSRSNLPPSPSAISTLSASGPSRFRPLALEGHEVGPRSMSKLSQIGSSETSVREQRGGACRGATAGDEISNGDHVGADAPRERRVDAGALKIEPARREGMPLHRRRPPARRLSRPPSGRAFSSSAEPASVAF